MNAPITRKLLEDWAGPQVVRDAEALLSRGSVLQAEYEAPFVRGAVLWNNRELKTGIRMHADGTVESLCPCYASTERGTICAHAIAVALLLVKRAADPQRDQKYREELRRASRLAAFDESQYIRRVPAGTPGAMPATLAVTLEPGWLAGCRRGRTPVLCEAEYQDRRLPLDQVPRHLPLSFSQSDETLLFVLEDIAEGPARGRLDVGAADLLNLLRLLQGHKLPQADGPPVTVNAAPLPTRLRLDLNRENGELLLAAHTELPFLEPGEPPLYVVAGRHAWAYGAANFWPLENVLPEPYHAIYAAPIVIARHSVLPFLQRELPPLAKHARLESDLSLDLFTVDPADPAFRLVIRGSPASLGATLYARYADLELVAAKPDPQAHFALPDPDDLLRYTVRNPRAEQRALERLQPSGLEGETGDSLSSLVGRHQVLNFLGGWLPALRRRGWRVEMEGRVAPYFESLGFATPVVQIRETAGQWFDVAFDFADAEGGSLSPNDVRLALQKGQSFLERKGRTVLIDADAVACMQDVFADCATSDGVAPGHFRMAGVHAAFVQSSLDALDGVDLEVPPAWRRRADQSNRLKPLEPVALGPPLDDALRPYQKEGVAWLRFLESNGFCGLLADEMGLGKTVQTLAWLRLLPHDAASGRKPSLIVCPTSIVDNWAEEAARFVPEQKVIPLSGAERHARWPEVPQADIVVTSYALLRRDLARYLEHEFAALVLDEAQHIKNRSTQNALSAKQLRAQHRLELTGTPVENGVADLWSIMDFLMPGYLGRHDAFRQNYELPIARGGPDAEAAQVKLRRKIHPFLLRRLKRDVARELPPKIEKTAFCNLSRDQQLVYTETLQASRQRLSRLVAERGLSACRMDILATLTRLRQICCHLDLLRLPNLNAKFPSAKLDLFLELLDEALDAGHRVLVFSQFVSMLQILRSALEARELAYAYLDGATRNRLEIIRQFNTQRDIPVFLISLKAGGTGVNLTGADMVIHFDPWWNPAVEQQATDRAYRIGQRRTVYSVKLIARGTVEEKVLALQQHKQAVIQATVESDESVVQSLSWEEIQELLNL